MEHVWPAQEAGNKFNEVIDRALAEGPQVITRQGKETAIVLSYEEYHKLTLRQKKLSTFFRESPLAEAPLDLTRDQALLRDELAL